MIALINQPDSPPKWRYRKHKLSRCMNQEALALYKEGLTLAEIADRLGVSLTLVWRRLRGVDGLPARRRGRRPMPIAEPALALHKQGLRLEEIAARLGVSTALVFRRIKDFPDYVPHRRGPVAGDRSRISPEVREKIPLWRAEGWTLARIAREVGCSRQYVSLILKAI
jgi:transcriptional regulator with XRE-family HTH domain